MNNIIDDLVHVILGTWCINTQCTFWNDPAKLIFNFVFR